MEIIGKIKSLWGKKTDALPRLICDNDAYWLKEGRITSGPFCTRCKDKDGLLIRLHGYSVTREYKRCPECETVIRMRSRAYDMLGSKLHHGRL